MRATVAIVTRDRLASCERAVASALAQVPPVEVLVLDDASTDGTSEHLRATFPHVRVERSPRRRGPAELKNVAMQLATTPYVVVLDDDAYFSSKRCVAQAIAAFDPDPVAVVTIPCLEVHRANEVRQQPPDAMTRYAAGVFLGGASAFRRDAFVDVGGYRAGLVERGEEGDLALRLLASGRVVAVGAGDHVVHCEELPRKSERAYFFTARNEVLLTWLSVPRRYLGIRLLAVVAGALLLGARGRRGVAVLQGMAAGLRAAWRRRSEREPAPAWAYRLTRRLRRQGAQPLDDVLAAVANHLSDRS